MSTGLKQVWGLDDAKAPPSTAQADQFKASYQAILNGINTALQYTVVNAEKPKHNEKAAGRDQLNSTYQAVLVKIDPSNPSAAQGAIQAALAAANAAAQAIGAFKSQVEAAVQAWQAQEPTFERSVTMVEELETWGHKQAATIRAIIGKIQQQVNQKALDPAVKAVIELMKKLQPIYDEYLKQVEAKNQYDPALAALQPKLGATAECRFKKLEPTQKEIVAVQGQMETAAQEKDYVRALPLLTDLTSKVDAYHTAVADLEKKKAEYEQAIAALQPKLGEAATCKYEKLKPMQQEIDTVKGQMETAAQNEDYEQALTLVNDLTTKVDAYHTAVDELDKKKAEYEQTLEGVKPKLTDAATPKYKKLEAQQKEITTAQGQMETAAQGEDFDQALTLVKDLSTKVDAYQTAVADLEKKKAEYEQGLAALQPKLADASQSQYEKLAPIQQEMVTIQGEMEKAAQGDDYEQAVKLLGDVTAKVDEYTKAKEEIERQKEEYEQGLAALQPKMPTSSEPQYQKLDPIQLEMTTIQGEMEKAAQAQDYEQALRLLGDLSAKLDEYLKAKEELDRQKQEYERGLAALQPRLAEASQCKAQFADLAPIQQDMATIQTEMETAATAYDYENALRLLADLSAKVEEYFAAIDKKKQEYETARAAAQDKMDGCMVTARDFSSLSGDRTALENKKKDMEAKAAAEEYDEAKKLAGELETLAAEYLKKAAEKQKEFDEKGEKLNKQLDAEEWDKRDDLARDLIKNMSADDKKYLPQAVRNRLMKELQEGDFEEADKAAINELYKVRTLDPEFEKADKQKRDKLLETLSKDPDMANARKNWGTMTADEKVKVMQKIAKAHTEAYGTKDVDGAPALSFDTIDEPKDADGSVLLGSYNHGSGKYKINTNADNPAMKDFDRAVNNATHEAGHRYQEVLAQQVQDGKIKKGDPLYDQAEAFRLNNGHYPTDPFDVYSNQPMEAHSRISGDAVAKAGVGK